MHNFYAQSKIYLGAWGKPPEKLLKISCLRSNLLAILAKSLLKMYCFNKWLLLATLQLYTLFL